MEGTERLREELPSVTLFCRETDHSSRPYQDKTHSYSPCLSYVSKQPCSLHPINCRLKFAAVCLLQHQEIHYNLIPSPPGLMKAAALCSLPYSYDDLHPLKADSTGNSNDKYALVPHPHTFCTIFLYFTQMIPLS